MHSQSIVIHLSTKHTAFISKTQRHFSFPLQFYKGKGYKIYADNSSIPNFKSQIHTRSIEMFLSKLNCATVKSTRTKQYLKSSDLLLILRHQLLQLLQLLVFILVIGKTFKLDSKCTFKTIFLLSQGFNLLLQHQILLKVKTTYELQQPKLTHQLIISPNCYFNMSLCTVNMPTIIHTYYKPDTYQANSVT